MRLYRSAAATLLLVAVAAVTGGALAHPARAAIGNTFAVLPTSGQQPGQVTRSNFEFEVSPGQAIKSSVTVVNLTKEPKYFWLYAADGYNTSGGGFAVTTRDTAPEDVGSWIELPFTSLKVPGKREANIEFTMQVPENATPGDHQGAIVAVDAQPTAPGDTPVGVAVQDAVFSRVYTRVAGPLTPGLDVEQVTVDRGVEPALVRYTLVNTGNTRLNPAVEVRATGAFGRELATLPAHGVEALVPGGRIELSVPWADPPALDLATVTVTATDEAVGVSDSESSSVFFWRWWMLLAALILLIAVLGWWLKGRRSGPAPSRAGSRHADAGSLPTPVP